MQIEGSCHCGAVRFAVDADAPLPYLRCYCSICRKTAGGGGFAINLGAKASTLLVSGKRNLRRYQALRADSKLSPAVRHFCGRCGSALWVADPRWPDFVHPFASAIDTPLPATLESVHMMLGSKTAWTPVEGQAGDARFDGYPEQSLADWHRSHGWPGAETG